MNPEWLRIAGQMLDKAADKMANAGCNDWAWPEGFGDKQRRELVSEMMERNLRKPMALFSDEELEEFHHYIAGTHGPADFSVCRFLAGKLTERPKGNI